MAYQPYFIDPATTAHHTALHTAPHHDILALAHPTKDTENREHARETGSTFILKSGRYEFPSGLNTAAQINYVSESGLTQPTVVIEGAVETKGRKGWQGIRFEKGSY